MPPSVPDPLKTAGYTNNVICGYGIPMDADELTIVLPSDGWWDFTNEEGYDVVEVLHFNKDERSPPLCCLL